MSWNDVTSKHILQAENHFIEDTFTFQWGLGVGEDWYSKEEDFIFKWGMPHEGASVLMGRGGAKKIVEWGRLSLHDRPPHYGKPCNLVQKLLNHLLDL